MRDDFSQSIKDLLENRVGWKCSNPNCRKITRGAGTEKTDGDKEIIKFFVQCFDRPAFHDKIYQEGSMEDSDIRPLGQKWSCKMTLPRELRIEKGKILQNPVRKIERYHRMPSAIRIRK